MRHEPLTLRDLNGKNRIGGNPIKEIKSLKKTKFVLNSMTMSYINLE